MDLSQYITPTDVPVCALECAEAFAGLTPKERLYAHHMSRASWAGSMIVLSQTSVESPAIFRFLVHLFSRMPLAELKQRVVGTGEVTEEDCQYLAQYAAQFFANMGNYLGFGDTKFVPRVEESKLAIIVRAVDDASLMQEYEAIRTAMYSLRPNERQLGLPPSGLTTYYSPNIAEDDIKLVQRFMTERGLSPYNTRLDKIAPGTFVLKFASARARPAETVTFEDARITLQYGDHATELQRVVNCLQDALPHVANELQRSMLEAYIRHFTDGDIEEHKAAQRHWVRDQGPIVETNIGFIESYRDPFGVRGEFEGLVSITNKAQTAKFSALVEQAPRFLQLLPWGPAFEKDTFHKPDFTSLEVLTFASSGLPAGINIPNYDDIRAEIGFKNVALGNVISARVPGEKFSFLDDSDQALYGALLPKAFEVQVGLHELLGHGSGKLLYEGKFDVAATLNPLTGQPVTSWYRTGETYDTKFQALSSSLEECRAECVGVYLCTHTDILRIFGYEGPAADDIYYVNWLNMVRAGVLALEFYTPETQTWRQAHMWARYAILRVLLEAGGGLVTIDRTPGAEKVRLNRAEIEPVGRPAIAEFLRKIMIYKATADYDSANKMYSAYTAVPADMLELRQVVLANKKPRKIFVQPHTRLLDGGAVTLQEFPATAEGMIQSNLAHFAEFV